MIIKAENLKFEHSARHATNPIAKKRVPLKQKAEVKYSFPIESLSPSRAERKVYMKNYIYAQSDPLRKLI